MISVYQLGSIVLRILSRNYFAHCLLGVPGSGGVRRRVVTTTLELGSYVALNMSASGWVLEGRLDQICSVHRYACLVSLDSAARWNVLAACLL